jgi:tetratricopeptide (TPR) repeat protein
MAKISLRIYKKEIENLIDRGQLEEATAHSKYILSVYPKYVDAYRLLAKAFLEAQKYSDAGDIFQRVLSVIPDDFISQIGTSIVKEDAGDLDGAIWHMERAFEAQPSNTPIQQELKRLYGKRDGVEPQKIRLTKGVLVRMYARSRLFPQAIAEAQAALAEDPSRTDLELILAQMYFQSNQKLDATEIASKVVTKLPFCLEANRILSEVLLNTSRSEDARKYRDRVNSLDPYYKFVSGSSTSLDDVPDNAVTLERLVWQSGMGTVSYPDLTLTDFSQSPVSSPEGPFPTEDKKPAEPVSTSEQGTQTENEIPDWMKTAGWQPSDQPTAPEVPIPSDEQVAEPAEIPDWLKEISLKDTGSSAAEIGAQNTAKPPPTPPAFAEESISPAQQSDSTEVPEWLRSTLDSQPKEQTTGNEPVAAMPAEPTSAPAVETSDENLPSWMKEIKSQPIFDPNAVETNTDMDSLPENLEQPQPDLNMPWLDSLSKEAPPEPLAPSTPAQKESSPWLEETNAPEPLPTPEPTSNSEELPEWLREIEITPEGEESLTNKPQTAPLSDQIPTWLQELKTSAPPEPEAEATPSDDTGEPIDESSQADLKNWLSSLETPDITPTTTPSRIETAEEKPPLKATPPEKEVIEVKAEEPAKVEVPLKKEEPLTPAPETYDHFVPQQIVNAEKAIESNNLTEALKDYRQMIRSGSLLDETITSIQKEIDKNSTEAMLWQILGDAYAKNNQLREALEAYNKAEQCLN